MKRLFCVFFVLFVSVFVFASSEKYSLSIKNADMVRVKGDFIQLSGNISLDFTSDAGDKYQLTAQKVTIDTDNKTLDASGSVVLTQTDKKQSFRGELVALDWEHMDIKVFDGRSVSERTGSSNQKVNFHSQGESISYAGAGNTVLFENGIVSTKSQNTNWSINAKQIELLDSDLFFRNATLRIGRVPLFWFPVFYYPGSRLGFNPSVGVSEHEGIFINTTTELFGTYSMIQKTGSSSVQENETDAVAGAVLSLLQDNDNSSLIREGLLYRKYETGQPLSKIESWARKTGSFMVLTADAYESKGLAIGYDSKLSFSKIKLSVNSKGLAAVNPGSLFPTLRFAFETDMTLSTNYGSLTINVPYYSDSTVKKQYFNRNTLFSFDSIFGTKQSFPSKYSSSVNSYIMTLTGSYSKTIGKFNFNLSSLKANINYAIDTNKKLPDNTFGFKISSMTLPVVVFTSSGTIFDFKGESSSVETERKFKTSLARIFSKVSSGKEEGTYEIPEQSEKAPSVKLTQTVTNSAPELKLSYNLNWNMDNYYNEGDFSQGKLTSKVSGTITTYGKGPGEWLNFTDVITPSYSFTLSEDDKKTHSVSVSNSISAKSSKLGLSYSLAQKVYSNRISVTEDGNVTEDPVFSKFDSSSVTQNQLEFKKTFDFLTLGVSTVFRPLTEKITPTLTLSKNGLSLSGNISLKRDINEEVFTKSAATVNLSYSNKYISSYLNNTYDFTKFPVDAPMTWEGYSNTARIDLKLSDYSFSCYSLMKMKDRFKSQNLESGLTFRKSNAVMTFTGEKLKPEKLKFNVKYDLAAKYFWKNRIGLESSMNATFNYNFRNKYAASLSLTFNLGFSINKFLDLNVSFVSTNSSFYNYYTDDGKFSFALLGKDLLKSVDFINGGIFDTNFNLSSFAVSIVHYMEDWNLYFEESGKIVSTNSSTTFEPQGKVYIKWNVIPEIKTENSYTRVVNEDTGRSYFNWNED